MKINVDRNIKYLGYCMHCKRRQQIVNYKAEIIERTGMPILRGFCAECGGKLNTILPKDLLIKKNES